MLLSAWQWNVWEVPQDCLKIEFDRGGEIDPEVGWDEGIQI